MSGAELLAHVIKDRLIKDELINRDQWSEALTSIEAALKDYFIEFFWRE